MKLILPLLVLISGCAALPPCDEFTANAVRVEGQVYAILDTDNIGKLNNLIRGLRDGTCGLEK